MRVLSKERPSSSPIARLGPQPALFSSLLAGQHRKHPQPVILIIDADGGVHKFGGGMPENRYEIPGTLAVQPSGAPVRDKHAATARSHDSYTSTQPDHLPHHMPVRRARVLCIGRVLGTLVTLKLVLEHYCEVDVVADITAALRHLSMDPPSLLFMHTSLPTLDGTRLLQLMRISLPDCPVILISDTDSTSPSSPEFSALPIYTFTGAPHRFNELLRAIAALLPAGRNPPGLPPPLSLQVTKALCYIGTHYAENLTVRKLGNEIGISEGYLAHLFRVEVQMGAKAFIMRVRVEVAKQLLGNQSYTLEHIAEELGFSDASHLSRVFRRFSGCPPSVYRREMRGS